VANRKDDALEIIKQLLKSNPDDNVGARYSALAILEGFKSQEHLEEEFDGNDGYIDWEKQEEWFAKNAKKYKQLSIF
jgi:hypothetical protein